MNDGALAGGTPSRVISPLHEGRYAYALPDEPLLPPVEDAVLPELDDEDELLPELDDEDALAELAPPDDALTPLPVDALLPPDDDETPVPPVALAADALLEDAALDNAAREPELAAATLLALVELPPAALLALVLLVDPAVIAPGPHAETSGAPTTSTKHSGTARQVIRGC